MDTDVLVGKYPESPLPVIGEICHPDEETIVWGLIAAEGYGGGDEGTTDVSHCHPSGESVVEDASETGTLRCNYTPVPVVEEVCSLGSTAESRFHTE